MFADLGYYGLVMALALCFASLPALWGRPIFSTRAISLLITVLVGASFGLLIYSFAISDFSIKLVFNHSSSIKPLLYKMTGAWGNHEGSMLLFVFLLCCYTGFYALWSKWQFQEKILVIQHMLIALILLYICFYSDPFVKLVPAPEEGRGLNPLLQDIGLALHPPMLYLGYTATSFLFSYGVLALWQKEVPNGWVATIRFYVYASLSLLTLGIGLGAWWAYRELGWGGFWFWDPVETASLMSWLMVLAFVHSMHATKSPKMLQKWTIFLGIMAFLSALLGFFLVRSGILTSVHAFASDPQRGVIMLIILSICAFVAVMAYSLRGYVIGSKPITVILGREGGMLWLNWILATLLFVVVLGILYPIMLDVLTQQTVAVGAPYFNKIFNPISLIAVFLAGVYVKSAWGKPAKFLLKWPSLVGVACFGYMLFEQASWLVAFAVAISAFTIVQSCIVLAKRVKQKVRLSAGFWAMFLGHVGIAVLAGSIALEAHYAKDIEQWVTVDEKLEFEDYELQLNRIDFHMGPNYVARQSEFSLTKDDKILKTLLPETRVYFANRQETSESSIYSTWRDDFYIVTGEVDAKKGVAMRFYYRPYMQLIWLGVLMVVFAGAVRVVSMVRERVRS